MAEAVSGAALTLRIESRGQVRLAGAEPHVECLITVSGLADALPRFDAVEPATGAPATTP